MNIDTLNAVIQGYQDRLFDQQCIAVHQGFWAGYYSIRTKRPKPVATILNTMFRNRMKAQNKQPHADEVDVDAFLAMEAEFKRRLEEQNAVRR